MPLIFAIDSDKRQSAQLSALLRSHVDADLVQSATVADGIAALGGRIPDLVLTASLLSPKDDAALANHMRELGARASHVHTLTIPVLATSHRASRKRPTGVLGALRREKSGDVDPAGCQPEVFGAEVRIYLERALDARAGAEVDSGVGAAAEPFVPSLDSPSLDRASEPVAAEPVFAEPVFAEPVFAEPVTAEPVFAEPVLTEPVFTEPVLVEPLQAAPIYAEPAEAGHTWTNPLVTASACAEEVAVVDLVVEAPVPEPTAVTEPALLASGDPAPGDIYLDQPEILARDALMAQAPAVVADAFAPPETRVPVVDMNTFDDLDSLAAQLAAPTQATLAVAVPVDDPFEELFVPQAMAVIEAAPDARPEATPDARPEATPDARPEAVVEPEPAVIAAVSSDTWFDRMTAARDDQTPVKREVPQAPEPVFSWIDSQAVSSLSDVLSRVRASDVDAHEPVPAPRAVPAVSQAAPEPNPIPPAVPDRMVEVPEPTPVFVAAVARPEVVVELVLPPAAPLLDPEVLAMFGVAAHRAGLDALESLTRPRAVERDQAIPALPIPGADRPRLGRESRAERRSRRKPPKPAQDEWGMFDPNQCGPAALFDEDAWNEVEAEEKVPARRPRA